MSELLKRLSVVQNTLKAPKGQYNQFGNYNYRNAEDILEAVKPILADNGLVLILTDEIENQGDRFYVKANAALHEIKSGETLCVSAYAREEENKKGMDQSQITGSASSYARKYALNGLFNIDDNKDADTNAYRKQQTAPPVNMQQKVTKIEATTLDGLITSYGADKIELLKYFNINDLSEMTKAQYAQCIGLLDKKYGKKQEGVIGNGTKSKK